MNNLDSLVITDSDHNIVCSYSFGNTDVIMMNGYHLYECKDEPFFESIEGPDGGLKYNPYAGN